MKIYNSIKHNPFRKVRRPCGNYAVHPQRNFNKKGKAQMKEGAGREYGLRAEASPLS